MTKNTRIEDRETNESFWKSLGAQLTRFSKRTSSDRISRDQFFLELDKIAEGKAKVKGGQELKHAAGRTL